MKSQFRFIISFILSVLMMVSAFAAAAQSTLPSSYLNASDIESIKSIVNYEKNKEGDWVRKSSRSLKSLPADAELFVNGKVIMNREIYAMVCSDEPGVYFTDFLKITFKKDAFKKYAENPEIEVINPENLDEIVDLQSQELGFSFDLLNAQRQEKMEIAAREERKRSEEERQKIEYRKSHLPYELDLTSYIETCRRAHASTEFFCLIKDCEYEWDCQDPVLNLVGFKNDTIITISEAEGPLGVKYDKAHLFRKDDRFLYNPDIRRHFEAWEDSLRLSCDMRGEAERINRAGISKLISELKKRAPHGFIKSYSLITETEPIALDVDFFNTSDKAIREIKFSYTLTGATGGEEISGNAEAPGPVEGLSAQNWILNIPLEEEAPTPRGIRIDKVTVIYTDNSEISLSGDDLIFDKNGN